MVNYLKGHQEAFTLLSFYRNHKLTETVSPLSKSGSQNELGLQIVGKGVFLNLETWTIT